jgi:hypothetical protein
MLVCSVSLRPPRRAVTVGIAEVVTATDALATGNIVFATLVDDPASVRETLDAYLGEIMVETASAAAVADAGLAYAATVDEAAVASESSSATLGGITRSAMIAGMRPVLVISATSRQANVGGTMVNL